MCELTVCSLCCKRDFSLRNVVKNINIFKYLVKEDRLFDLMIWNMNGPSVIWFGPSEALVQWFCLHELKVMFVVRRETDSDW